MVKDTNSFEVGTIIHINYLMYILYCRIRLKNCWHKTIMSTGYAYLCNEFMLHALTKIYVSRTVTALTFDCDVQKDFKNQQLFGLIKLILQNGRLLLLLLLQCQVTCTDNLSVQLLDWRRLISIQGVYPALMCHLVRCGTPKLQIHQIREFEPHSWRNFY